MEENSKNEVSKKMEETVNLIKELEKMVEKGE